MTPRAAKPRTLLALPDDGYGNAPEMAPVPIVDPLTDAEVAELMQQIEIAAFLVKSRTRIPDDLVLALSVLERRFSATADEARLYAAVKTAKASGKPRARGRNPSAFDAAAAAMGISASRAEKVFYGVENMKRKPLASTPKKTRKK